MDRAATIGSFDGMHRGHRLVLDVLKKEASERGLQPMAITFDRHPLELIAPDRAPGNLMSAARKTELINADGVMPVLLPFTDQLRHTSAFEWLSHIHRKYGVSLVVVGYDNTFGCDGADFSLADYAAMGDTIGLDIVCAPQIPGVSSSAVRKAVKGGDILSAREMLGHLPELEGRVTFGFHVGTDIGFPTANLQVSPRMVIPLDGVYAAFAYIDGSSKSKPLPAMVNIGVRPTFDGTASASAAPSVEAHIIGLDGDIYGSAVRLEFIDRLRDEKRFLSVAELQMQLAEDRRETLRICENLNAEGRNA